jgi:LacI family transcriptional regulator
MLIKKRVTIKEVAHAAGVSTQTVSRVLNNRPDVSDETRERIQAVIANLEYSPNALARSLIQGRSNTLGVVGYGLSYYGPSRVLTGIERRANELGYSLLLSLLRDPEVNTGERLFHALRDRQVDGIIWAVPEIGANRDWIAKKQLPTAEPVVFINMEPGPGLSVVAVNNREGGRMATTHLLRQGYQRIGIITGPDSWWESRQREQGWRSAMQEAGFSHGDLDAWKIAGDWYPSSGEAGLSALLQRRPDLEAVFACNDPMAAGALRAARQLGRRVPQELAIVGYDDTPEAPYYEPPLSTVRQPLVEMGGQAVDMLLRLMDDARSSSEPESTNTLWMQPELIMRTSSAHP